MIEMNIYQLLALVGTPSIISGVFLVIIQRQIAKRDKKRDDKESSRIRLEELLVNGVGTSIALGVATANSVRKIDKSTNGDMTNAVNMAINAKTEMRDFLSKEGLKTMF